MSTHKIKIKYNVGVVDRPPLCRVAPATDRLFGGARYRALAGELVLVVRICVCLTLVSVYCGKEVKDTMAMWNVNKSRV